MEFYSTDHDFINTLGIDLIEGRGFSQKFKSDINNAVIINESAVRQFGWKNPVGKKLKMIWRSDVTEYNVIGIVKDFHSRSLHHIIEPLAIFNTPDYHIMTLRMKPDKITESMKLIKAIWNDFEPNHPFEYFFMDDNIDSLYRTEVKIGRIVQVFAILAIAIGCLGLFGLVSFMTERRTKEIGIRKVIGASTANITALLTKEFTKWILLANLFSWPVAYFTVNQWLQNFAYKVNVSWKIFVLAAVISGFITLITIAHHVIKAAYANPVDSLKYE
jgi:putative ABC transport system permease protein